MDYTETEYVDSKTKLKTRCPIHGIQEQYPRDHMRTLKGCGSCGWEEQHKKRIVDLTGEIFGKLTVLGRNLTKKSANLQWDCLCECGNITTVAGNDLKRKSGLSKKGIRSCGCLKWDVWKDKVEDFTETAIENINLKTNYDFIRWSNSENTYEGKHTEVQVSCKDCDTKRTQLYITLFRRDKKGYPSCNLEERISGYKDYLEGCLYLARIFTSNKDVLKIGITNQTPFKRLSNIVYGTDCTFELIGYLKGSGADIRGLEQKLLKKYKDYQCNTGELTSGNTECFNTEILDFVLGDIGWNLEKRV